MAHAPGQAFVLTFETQNPATGAGQDADSLPTAILIRNGAADISATVTHRASPGRYYASGTVPATYAEADEVALEVAATVAGITGYRTFQLGPLDVSNASVLTAVAAQVNTALTVSTSSPPVPGVDNIDLQFGQSWSKTYGVTVNGTPQDISLWTAFEVLVKRSATDLDANALLTFTLGAGLTKVATGALGATLDGVQFAITPSNYVPHFSATARNPVYAWALWGIDAGANRYPLVGGTFEVDAAVVHGPTAP